MAFHETETHDMKHHVRTIVHGTALLVGIAMMLGACGGKQTMASKSAAAYDEARKKGLPVSADEHGGHEAGRAAEPVPTTSAATSEHGSMPGMDHSGMAGMDHSQMTATGHAGMPGMQHGGGNKSQHEMPGMDHSGMPGMDHSHMSGMQHGSKTASAHSMAGMDHSSMAGMDHAQMSGMQHGSAGQPHDMSAMQHGSMAGMQHGSAAPLAIAPPTSNSAIAQTQPASTLRRDEFDAPAPSAIDEAAKAAGGTPPPPKPPPHEHGHDGGGEPR